MTPDVAGLVDALAGAVGAEHVLTGESVKDDHTHDEALTATPVTPLAVVLPGTTDEVAAVLRLADERRVPVTARGAGTGLSGACTPRPGGIVVAFDRMASVVEVDTENFVAVVEPGVRLDQLDAVLAPLGLVYPVFPGEYSASLGGNVNTNAGGMRAVKYGVTRHHVLGIEAVLPSGEVVRDGGKMVKRSTGYDLTQLVVGSEGTLALVTRVWLRLYPRPPHQATLLAPFTTLDEVTAAVPEIVRSGVGPLVLEYIDTLTMAAATAYVGLDLGIPDDVKEAALAYLVVGLESTHADRLDADSQAVASQLAELGALDVYVLPPGSAAGLIDAREKAFWVAKANGADDIIDVVVPRAAVPAFMARVTDIAQAHQAWIAGCGHAGDGNVHMAVFQKDAAARGRIMRALMEAGMALGGAISGEHGLGTEKARYFLDLEDPAKVALMRRIKAAFDPHGILNPGTIFGDPTAATGEDAGNRANDRAGGEATQQGGTHA
ncbi:MAG TPA: FAD-linked oxidase C-terminal domain-containing protein [Acidimicrobiales bacterium]|nr:FAD-linked oxidase C-terminal domain-containing protein [Acidimicrobiales bacterium]